MSRMTSAGREVLARRLVREFREGTSGDLTTKARAADGAFYHAYAVRPMKVAEYRTMGDGMYADASDADAAAAVAAWNERHAR